LIGLGFEGGAFHNHRGTSHRRSGGKRYDVTFDRSGFQGVRA
jgi:hypothetical protein